jgi:SAM-dependent methyltransferase
MVFEFLKLNKKITDNEFDTIYPENLKKLGHVHWTPVEVAIEAVAFLTDIKSPNILDIGSGAGKFCLIGAAITKADFTGVELRPELYKLAKRIAKHYGLPNTQFINSNILEVDFSPYNAFYYFNPFYENIEQVNTIDDTLDLKTQNYNIYTKYVKQQLEGMPKGTRLVTYWSSAKDVPLNYTLQGESMNGLLEMWEKTY